ncbi:MAG: hypothetical protein ACYCXY_01445 [Acidimicrobiales bacterium]
MSADDGRAGLAAATAAGRHDPLAPDAEALAAILAAIEQCAPVAGAFAVPPLGAAGRPGWRTRQSYPWRFSGRWWTGPAPLRRERPGR